MMNFGNLNWFDSFIKKMKESNGLYQPRDLHLSMLKSVMVYLDMHRDTYMEPRHTMGSMA